jgi:hypothetical protein
MIYILTIGALIASHWLLFKLGRAWERVEWINRRVDEQR